MNSLRSSVKRREIYDQVCVELGLSHELPSLDVDTRWYSRFQMVLKSYKARRVINSVVNRIPELDEIYISEIQCKMAEIICAFLEEAVSVN